MIQTFHNIIQYEDGILAIPKIFQNYCIVQYRSSQNNAFRILIDFTLNDH